MDSVWTIPLITHDIEKELHISVSTDAVTRALKELGYSYKRPSKKPPPVAPGREEKIVAINRIIRNIQEITRKGQSTVYALDESYFSTEPYLVQGWFKKRWPPWDPHSLKKGTSHVLWLLESVNTKILLEKVLAGRTVNSSYVF